MDHSKQHYYEAQLSGNGMYRFRIYHYDETGNRRLAVHTSGADFDTENDAMDAAIDWIEESGLEERVGEIKLGG